MNANFGELELFLNARLNALLNSIREERETGNNQTIKNEVAKLASQLEEKGFSKEKLLVYLKEVFEPKDFDDKGKYKGGVDLIIKTVKEELKPYTTKKEVEAKLTELETKIDQKFKPYKNWEEIKKEFKSLVDKYVVEGLRANEAILKALRKVFGEERFYADTPSKDIPAGREGMHKDPLAIAILERDAKKQVEAMDKWDKFFDTDHVITDAQEKSWWMKKYPANPDGAENVYKQALLEAEDLVVGSEPLTNREKESILKATMPDKIKEAVQNIPLKRKEKEWQNFFNTSPEIKEEWKKHWVVSGLTITQAETAYKNGWRNDPDKGIIKNGLIAEYAITLTILDKPLKKTARNINPLQHSAIEVEKALKFIIKEVKAQTDLTKFPIDNVVNGAYQEEAVPDTLSHSETKKYRDGAIVNLFKQYFEGTQPSKLNDKQIDLWRTSSTGLKMNGTDQRIAFDNGWIDPTKIANGKWPNHKGVQNIDVLTTKQVAIDNEIAQVDSWVNKVKGYTKMRQLDQNLTEIDKVVNELKEPLLPAGKKEELTIAIQTAKDTLLYYGNDPEDGGIENNQLQVYENKIKKQWKTRNYAQFNTQILQAFIDATDGIKLKPDEKWQAGNIDTWLKSKGAYAMDETPEGKQMLANEDKLPLELRGQFLLPFLMGKVKDARGNALSSFDVLDENSFCIKGFRKESRWGKEKEYPIIQGTQGHLAFSTGSGKSTKVINCICRGGGKDGKGGIDPITGGKSRKVVMVVPEQVLVDNIYKHQAGWMQSYGCVICQIPEKGVKCKKGTYTRASEEDIRNGNYEEKDILKSHGEYKVVKNDLIPRGETGLSIINGDELIGWLDRQLLLDSGEIDNWKPDPNDPDWFKSQEEINAFKKYIQDRVIDKENDLILVDEGHFAIGSYQRAQIQAVHNDYKVIRMSATFEGIEFSITSTYPRENIFLGGSLNPRQPFGLLRIDNLEQANKLATLRKVDVSQIKWKDAEGKLTPVAVNLDERLRVGKTAIFLPDEKPTPAQLRALIDKETGQPVGNIFYTPEWDPYLESMSYGMSDGSLSGLGTRHGVGINGDFDTVLLSGKMYVKNLGKRFQFGKASLLNLDDADGVQMIGRTGRHMHGGAGLMSLKWEPIDAKNDVQSAMTDAIFDGELKHIVKEGYKMLSDIAMLRAAVALPKKFGRPLAEILIGLNVDEDAEATRVEENEKAKAGNTKYTYKPLTKINWRNANQKPKGSKLFGDVDEGLWNSYVGKAEAITMEKDQAKDRLLESINTFIKEDSNFPRNIKVKNQSNLIEYVWGDEIKTNKQAVIDKIKEVLNGVVSKAIDDFKARGVYDGTNKTSKDKRTIEQITNYYQITDAMIDISMMPKVGEENKQVLTLRIEK